MFDTFAYFTKCFPQVCLVLEILFCTFPVKDLFCHCTWIISAFLLIFFASYKGVCIDMFVHLITVSVLLCLSLLYNLIFGYTSSWCFVLYLLYAWFITALYHCYICVCIIILWILYLWFLRYVLVLHTIWSLFELHLVNHVMHISCILFVISSFQYLLTYIHNIGLTSCCLN